MEKLSGGKNKRISISLAMNA